MKFFMQRGTLYDLKNLGNNNGIGFPLNYPMFIRFTAEDKIDIQRNFLEATLNGMNPELRRVCLTSNCTEGFKLSDLMEDMQNTEEVSEEEFNLFGDIPHWNPVEFMGIMLEKYVKEILAVRRLQDESNSTQDLETMVQECLDAIDKEAKVDLPKANYSHAANP